MSRIRVLVVDDSAFARKVIREMLSRDSAIEVVGVARDGLEALEKVAQLRPDVMTLDLIMPELDGLGVLRELPKERPPRVIVVSVSRAQSELAIEALQRGAVELVTKPSALATDSLQRLSAELVTKVKEAAQAVPMLGPASPAPLEASVPARRAAHAALGASLIVIGTSTGGPQALTKIFGSLPTALPVPVAIALHIPTGYTAPLAARLSQLGGTRITEAFDGMELRPSEGAIAPGGMHLCIRRAGSGFVAAVSRQPLTTPHHPSVDLLFESAAEQAGSGALGVILTGMGDDGLRGSRAIRRAGGYILAQSAASCVVYGMPRSVIEASQADAEAPLASIPQRLAELVFRVRE
jgi:two-component system, chemotaxis family, protein-glutamate methylesterase/glutaminase